MAAHDRQMVEASRFHACQDFIRVGLEFASADLMLISQIEASLANTSLESMRCRARFESFPGAERAQRSR
jgi:hypothetical protein